MNYIKFNKSKLQNDENFDILKSIFESFKNHHYHFILYIDFIKNIYRDIIFISHPKNNGVISFSNLIALIILNIFQLF